MPKVFSYNKNEKLKSRKQLENIFTSGKTFTVFPIKVFFGFVDEQDSIVKAGVGVSKRFFKKAVDRNYIKRLLRESYRTEKVPLNNQMFETNKKLKLFFLFIDGNLPGYNLIQQKMKLIIEKLSRELNKFDETVA